MHLGSKSGGSLVYAADSISVSRALRMLTEATVWASLEIACSRPSCRAMTWCPRVDDRVVKPLHSCKLCVHCSECIQVAKKGRGQRELGC